MQSSFLSDRFQTELKIATILFFVALLVEVGHVSPVKWDNVEVEKHSRTRNSSFHWLKLSSVKVVYAQYCETGSLRLQAHKKDVRYRTESDSRLVNKDITCLRVTVQ